MNSCCGTGPVSQGQNWTPGSPALLHAALWSPSLLELAWKRRKRTREGGRDSERLGRGGGCGSDTEWTQGCFGGPHAHSFGSSRNPESLKKSLKALG